MRHSESRKGFRGVVTSLLVAAACVAVLSTGAQAANKLIVQDNNSTDKFVVTDGGFTGIGTNAPGTALEVLGLPGVFSRILLRTDGQTTAAGGGGLLVLHNNLPADNGGYPKLGDRLGFFLFGAKQVGGTGNFTGGGVTVRAADAWSATSWPTDFMFETAPSGSATRAERMRVSSSGHVGVNCAVPSQQFEVAGGVRLNPAAAITAVTKSTCSATVAGTLWFTPGGGLNGADLLEVCAKDGTSAYDWRKIY